MPASGRRDPVPALRRPLRRRPGLVGRLTRRAAKAAWERVAPETSPAEARELFLHQFGAGFIDLAGGRYLVDFGGYAQVLVDGRRFGGLSGEPLGPRYELRPHKFRRDDPLDALRKLQRATRPAGPARSGCAGRPAASRWSRRAPTNSRSGSMTSASSGSGRWNAGLVGPYRRQGPRRVELWDFGVPVDSLDWSRLPSFRTPR